MHGTCPPTRMETFAPHASTDTRSTGPPPIERIAVNEGWKGRIDRAGNNGRHGVFDGQLCPARLQCEGEQRTGRDRVHAAGDAEEPAIQFRTRLLIGLQQHPRRRRHQHHSHHQEEVGEASDHPKDDQPPAVRSAPVAFATGRPADPVLVRPMPCSKQARPKWSLFARADSPPSRARR